MYKETMQKIGEIAAAQADLLKDIADEKKRKSNYPKPFVKWVGGKRQLIKDIRFHAPKNFNSLIEPFVGGGGVLFGLKPNRAIINDTNEELINCYLQIKDNLPGVVFHLEKMSHLNLTNEFYKIRAWDRPPFILKDDFSKEERAARFIYLNKTCFSGLYRVNQKNQFNCPFGKYKNPNILDTENLISVSKFLQKVVIWNRDFRDMSHLAGENDFVYFDPPYDETFTGYSENGFDRKDQKDLSFICKNLNKRGVKFLLSNSNTPFINDLYSEFNIYKVAVNRNISRDPAKRGKVIELLIKNY